MISENRKKVLDEKEKLLFKLGELKSSNQNILFNLIIKLITLGKIDLKIKKEADIKILISKIDNFENIFKRIDSIESKLDQLTYESNLIYIREPLKIPFKAPNFYFF